jgi:hypothetical protein
LAYIVKFVTVFFHQSLCVCLHLSFYIDFIFSSFLMSFFFLYSTASRPALGPTQLPIQRVRGGGSFPGVHS